MITPLVILPLVKLVAPFLFIHITLQSLLDDSIPDSPKPIRARLRHGSRKLPLLSNVPTRNPAPLQDVIDSVNGSIEGLFVALTLGPLVHGPVEVLTTPPPASQDEPFLVVIMRAFCLAVLWTDPRTGLPLLLIKLVLDLRSTPTMLVFTVIVRLTLVTTLLLQVFLLPLENIPLVNNRILGVTFPILLPLLLLPVFIAFVMRTLRGSLHRLWGTILALLLV